jgi:hypothetical protein
LRKIIKTFPGLDEVDLMPIVQRYGLDIDDDRVNLPESMMDAIFMATSRRSLEFQDIKGEASPGRRRSVMERGHSSTKVVVFWDFDTVNPAMFDRRPLPFLRATIALIFSKFSPASVEYQIYHYADILYGTALAQFSSVKMGVVPVARDRRPGAERQFVSSLKTLVNLKTTISDVLIISGDSEIAETCQLLSAAKIRVHVITPQRKPADALHRVAQSVLAVHDILPAFSGLEVINAGNIRVERCLVARNPALDSVMGKAPIESSDDSAAAASTKVPLTDSAPSSSSSAAVDTPSLDPLQWCTRCPNPTHNELRCDALHFRSRFPLLRSTSATPVDASLDDYFLNKGLLYALCGERAIACEISAGHVMQTCLFIHEIPHSLRPHENSVRQRTNVSGAVQDRIGV